MSTIWQMVRVMKLFEAAENGYLNEVKRLVIDWGVDPNVRERHGITPLHYAARNGHLEVVEFLLEHGADPNARIKYGYTPLHVAAFHCNDVAASILIDHGADPTIKDNEGRTPSDVFRKRCSTGNYILLGIL